jgi:serine/threonine-protein kinase
VTDGVVLAGRYEIGALLGRGGMAEVRAGWDLRLGRAVAVKTLLPGLAEQAAVRRRFEGEARAAARLSHPNAVAVFDVGEDGGVPFLVMEQVVGPTLEEDMGRGPLDAGRVRRLGEELLGALGAAHSAGLVHRDVKPANVLMAPDGSAKVADFGIAKAVADEDGATLQVDLTSTGQMFGTVAYMAPERLAGRPASVQSDIYSVGVVLYEALTGTRPFAAPTPIGVVRAIDEARPPPLRDCLPDLDTALIAAVERAMAKNPENRFASAGEMSAALRAGAGPAEGGTGDVTVIAAPVGMVGPATEILDVPPASPGEPARPASRGPIGRRWVVALLAVAALAVALIANAVGGDDDPPSPPTPAVTAPPSTVVSTTPPENPAPTTPRTEAPPRKGKGKK